ncbi:hypothetical protein NA57DRAFT_59703 [Rhizodiscina lignyota]|uniref:Uncharacterized protein n=1 Tax=Rhizodiscina lignyota TaxID=1504668 RepID=A0A9P4IA82_9PEZI|nr:hypothetical protein NA57DRAFT_59703 [Rhizodiscina lignyota]
MQRFFETQKSCSACFVAPGAHVFPLPHAVEKPVIRSNRDKGPMRKDFSRRSDPAWYRAELQQNRQDEAMLLVRPGESHTEHFFTDAGIMHAHERRKERHVGIGSYLTRASVCPSSTSCLTGEWSARYSAHRATHVSNKADTPITARATAGVRFDRQSFRDMLCEVTAFASARATERLCQLMTAGAVVPSNTSVAHWLHSILHSTFPLQLYGLDLRRRPVPAPGFLEPTNRDSIRRPVRCSIRCYSLHTRAIFRAEGLTRYRLHAGDDSNVVLSAICG